MSALRSCSACQSARAPFLRTLLPLALTLWQSSASCSWALRLLDSARPCTSTREIGCRPLHCSLKIVVLITRYLLHNFDGGCATKKLTREPSGLFSSFTMPYGCSGPSEAHRARGDSESLPHPAAIPAQDSVPRTRICRSALPTSLLRILAHHAAHSCASLHAPSPPGSP